MEGLNIVKLGTVEDDAYVSGFGLPKQEIYCKNMWKWEQPIAGAATKQGAS